MHTSTWNAHTYRAWHAFKSKLYKHLKPLVKYCGRWKYCRNFLLHYKFWRVCVSMECVYCVCMFPSDISCVKAANIKHCIGLHVHCRHGRQFLNLSWHRQTTQNSTRKFELLKIYCQQCHDAMQTMFVHIPHLAHHPYTNTSSLCERTQ